MCLSTLKKCVCFVLCFDCTNLYHHIVSNTTAMSKIKNVKGTFDTCVLIVVVIVQAKGPIILDPSCHTIGVPYTELIGARTQQVKTHSG